jgi:hypothetical protein
VKARRDADDGDARGRRHLLGGVVLALLVLPRLEHGGDGGTLEAVFDSGNNGATASFSSWGRRLGGSWCHWCAYWSRWWPPLKAWAFGALCTPSLVLRGRRILWPGLAPLLTRRLLGAYGQAVHWRVPSRSSNQSREALFFGCDAAWKPGVSHPCHSWLKTVQGGSLSFVGVG